MSGSICARTSWQTVSTRPTKISSALAAPHGTTLWQDHSKSHPSPAATGQKRHDFWRLVLESLLAHHFSRKPGRPLFAMMLRCEAEEGQHSLNAGLRFV